jgi:hypothetical protein
VNKLHIVSASIALVAFLLAGNIAIAQSRTNVGELECFVAEGTGFIVGSDKDISCTLIDPNGVELEYYVGELKKYGIDIGFTRESVLRWSVYVPKENPYQPETLAGTYRGASASASIAVGLGTSVLIGGLSDNYALQPIKVNQQEGINIALGITRMELRSVRNTEDPEDNPEIQAEPIGETQK